MMITQFTLLNNNNMPTTVKAYLGTTPLFTTSSADWARPADWLALPAATANSVRGLYAVFDQTENYVTVQMQTNDNSSYTINWGDGNTTTAASNTLITYNYSYNNAALNGTLSTRGYKQAVITITPQAGKNFTLCRLDVKPTTPAGIQNATSSAWLDLNINLPNLIAGRRLYIGSSTGFVPRLLERVNITSWGAITDTLELFRNTASLASINDTEWNFSNITRVDNMFFTSGIREVNGLAWDVSKVTNFANMFRDCSNLRSVKCSNWNTSAATNMGYMFMACGALEDIDVSAWNVSNNQTFSYMFQSCRLLKNINVANWNTSKATVINNMFEGCTSLTTLATTNWSLPLCTNAAGFINLCPNLQKVGPLNLSAVTEYFTVPSIGTTVPFAGNCFSLKNVNFSGIKASINFTNCMLGATVLNALYASLATVTGQTITVTGNYGTASDDPTIAQAKGWTVIG